MRNILFISALIASVPVFAGTVIANGDVKISSGDVKDVFTGEKSSAEGIKLVVVDNKAAQSDFCSKVIGVDAAKYTANWAKKSFRDGIPAPKVKNSDSEVIEFVKSNSGAVGYIAGAASGGVKEVSKF